MIKIIFNSKKIQKKTIINILFRLLKTYLMIFFN
jgi:hypothetical protein